MVDSKEEIRKEEIRKDAMEIEDWVKRNNERLIQYYEEINDMLSDKQSDGRGALVELFQNKEFQADFYQDAVIAQLSIVLGIYQSERDDKIVETILDQGGSIQQLNDFFLALKFKLWRVEQVFDKEAIKGFYEFVESRKVTIHALKYIIHTSCFEKLNTAFKIATIFRDSNKPAKAFAMFNYALELSPGEEIILCEMADICMANRQYDMVPSLLEMIKEKTNIFREYQSKWGSTDE